MKEMNINDMMKSKQWELGKKRFNNIIEKFGHISLAKVEQHISIRTNRIGGSLKAVVWARVLENEDFHTLATDAFLKAQNLVEMGK